MSGTWGWLHHGLDDWDLGVGLGIHGVWGLCVELGGMVGGLLLGW